MRCLGGHLESISEITVSCFTEVCFEICVECHRREPRLNRRGNPTGATAFFSIDPTEREMGWDWGFEMFGLRCADVLTTKRTKYTKELRRRFFEQEETESCGLPISRTLLYIRLLLFERDGWTGETSAVGIWVRGRF